MPSCQRFRGLEIGFVVEFFLFWGRGSAGNLVVSRQVLLRFAALKAQFVTFLSSFESATYRGK